MQKNEREKLNSRCGPASPPEESAGASKKVVQRADRRAFGSEAPEEGGATGVKQVTDPPSPNDLELAVRRVTQSRCFARSPRQRTLLVHMAGRVKSGELATLKESVLAIEVFGREPDRFNPTRDTIVRVEVRRLRQRLARYYATEGASDALEIALPIGSYVPSLQPRTRTSRTAGTRRARDLVERGDHFLREGLFEEALSRYEEALKDCDTYVAAHVGLARAWINLSMSGLRPPEPSVDLALAALSRSLALEPELPEAYALKGMVIHRFQHNWADAEPQLKRAAELAPHNARVRDLYGFQLMFAGLLDEAEAQMQCARELDPQNPAFRLHMGWLRMTQRRWEESEKEYEALLDIAPDHFWALLARADLMLYQGRCLEAIELYRDAGRRFPEHSDCKLGEACALFALGRNTEGQRLLRRARPSSPPPSPYAIAEVMAARGRFDQALVLLRRSARERDPLFLAGTTSPLFEPMYADPRFQKLYQRARAQALHSMPRSAPS